MDTDDLDPIGPGESGLYDAGCFGARRALETSTRRRRASTPQQLPLFDSCGAIHLQKADCDPAPGGQAEDFAAAKLVVVLPAIKAWMKQRRELSGFGIY